MIDDDLKNKILEGFKYFTNRYAQDTTYRKGDKTTHDKLSNFCENFKIFSNDIFSKFKIVDHGKWQNSGNISKYIYFSHISLSSLKPGICIFLHSDSKKLYISFFSFFSASLSFVSISPMDT